MKNGQYLSQTIKKKEIQDRKKAKIKVLRQAFLGKKPVKKVRKRKEK